MLENRVVARQNRFCSYGRQVQQPVTFFDLCCAANQLAYTSQAEKKRFLAIWTIKRLGDSAMNKMHRAGLALVLAACAMPALAQESAQEMRPYRSEERRGGKAWGSRCSARWSPYDEKKK